MATGMSLQNNMVKEMTGTTRSFLFTFDHNSDFQMYATQKFGLNIHFLF